ncbi:hypothetical protein [Companilactobacillus mishanensis]|uniref:hypothetical protein n=1 Tax=Companilactobacillus mishanensis TaxID=2486008 RepID=UPI00129493F2|nr:hypothetical protein [Companilactobacillus mishanensis]
MRLLIAFIVLVNPELAKTGFTKLTISELAKTDFVHVTNLEFSAGSQLSRSILYK